MASRQTDVMSDDDDDEVTTSPAQNAATLAPAVSLPADTHWEEPQFYKHSIKTAFSLNINEVNIE
jgi:hypothetical protein